MRRRLFGSSLVILGLATAGSVCPADVKISPEAQSLVTEMSKAYSALGSLDLKGTLSADIDIAGKTQKENQAFSASYQSPAQFRHEIKDDILVGSTGEKVYAHAKSNNVYFTAAAPEGKPEASDLPPAVRQTLESQNPSLLMAVSRDPAATLKADVEEISSGGSTTVDGKPFDTLVLSMGADKPSARVLLDPKTHLIRQVRTDLKADLTKRGAPDVKKAVVTVDYTTTAADAPVAKDVFAFAAPAGAREVNPTQADNGGEAGAAGALVGKPAPDFTLTLLDGKTKVTLKEQKGSVVILDFWATWCGPCVEGLPHIDAIYKDKKDAGVKAFAVNMQEDAAAVKAFIEKKKLSLPVLMETKGDVAEKYKVEGIPETVVIGKDGTVKKVFVGTGPDTEKQVRKAVEEALK